MRKSSGLGRFIVQHPGNVPEIVVNESRDAGVHHAVHPDFSALECLHDAKERPQIREQGLVEIHGYVEVGHAVTSDDAAFAGDRVVGGRQGEIDDRAIAGCGDVTELLLCRLTGGSEPVGNRFEVIDGIEPDVAFSHRILPLQQARDYSHQGEDHLNFLHTSHESRECTDRQPAARLQSMFDLFTDLATRPACFSVLTAHTLWTDPHLAEQMLRFHLDPETPLASRAPAEIDEAVAWLNELVGLAGKRVVDLGCGPGLYASRFCKQGAVATGMDWSKSSLAHARAQAAREGQQIDYLLADYTRDPLPQSTDLFTLIYCDFCALSPSQRHRLLKKIRAALSSGGLLAMDVHGTPYFDSFQEKTLIERRLMGGFWSANDYVGVKQSIRYPAEQVTLDRYLIVEPDRLWSVFNWLQTFSPNSLQEELTAAGFTIRHLSAGFTGAEPTSASELICVLAEAG